MDPYLLIKAAHILSATILFGTGLGIASLMFFGHRAGNPSDRAFAARMTVRADFLFTLPAAITQPVTGILLIALGGFDWTETWLVATYALYVLTGLCWLPVVLIQMRMKALLDRQASGQSFDHDAYQHLYRVWFALGWPAFTGLLIVFWLMVAKPQW